MTAFSSHTSIRSIRKVALAGASGTVGRAVLQALLAAKYEVTALSRLASSSNFSPSVKVAKVDFDDVECLSQVLKDHDALIVTIAITASDQQKLLMDAAVRAGVKRIIPSDFGGDLADPKAQALPVFAPKIAIEKHIEQAVKGTQSTYTFIYNNLFLNWDIDYGDLFLVQPKQKMISIVDGGNKHVTLTPLSMLAQAITAVLGKPQETANRRIRIQGISISKRRLLELAQGVVEESGWRVTEARSDELEADAWHRLRTDPDNAEAWVLPFLQSASWGNGYNNDFTGQHDNDLLGLQEVQEDDVLGLIRAASQRH